MKQYYDRYWNTLPAELGDFRFKWPIISRYIPRNVKSKILDYGCGKGKILSEIYRINPDSDLYGADISTIALQSAKQSVPKAKVLVINGDQRVPLPSRSIDFIVCLDVIEHIYDTEKVFREFNRLLKKNGMLFLSTPYHGLIKNLIIALVGFETVYDPMSSHIRFYTKGTLYNMVRRFGFQPLTFGMYGRFPPLSNGMYLLAQKKSRL